MVWGIIGALDEEIRLIRERMEPERTFEAYGLTYHIGRVGGESVIAVCCGVGTINAAVCTSTIIRELGAEAVVNIGVAGSASRELGILDVVLSDEVMFHDAQLDILEKYPPHRRSFPADPALIERAARSIESIEDRGFSHRIGRVATGDVFVDNEVLRSRIIGACSPLCVEMEGAAVGQVSYMNGVPFLVIRAMSDDAGEEADMLFDDFLSRAAANSARIVLGMISG